MTPQPDYDEFGRPIQHPIAKAIQDAYMTPPPSIIPQNFSGVVPPTPSPSQSIYAPGSPVPVDMTPIPPTPTQQAIQNLHVPQHTDPNVQNSKLRTVLNAIAGGFAGAAGRPEMGAQLRDAKYNAATQDYKAKLGQLQTSSDVEQLGVTGAEKRESLKTGRIGTEYKAESAAELNRIREENAQTAARKAEDYGKNIESLTKLREANEAKIKELTDHAAMQNEAIRKALETGDLSHIKPFYNPSTKETPEEAAAKAAAVQEARDKQALTPTGQQANISRAAGRVIGTGTPAALAAGEAAAGAKAKGAGEAKTTPEMIERDAALSRAKALAMPTATMRDTSAFAREALPHVNEAIAKIPKLQPKLGPILGRWNDFLAGKVGAGDPDFMTLRDTVLLLNTNLGRVHGGARGGGSKFMLEHFKSMANAGKMDAQTLTASLKVFQDWLSGYANMSTLDLSKPIPAEELAKPPWEGGSRHGNVTVTPVKQ